MVDGLMWSMVLAPLGLGLLGFFEPCSIGSSLVFIKTLEGKSTAIKFLQASMFTMTRAAFIGVLGAIAALIGTAFLAFQKAGWMVLGGVYLVLGCMYLYGKAGVLFRAGGLGIGRLTPVHGATALGVLFGLNVPACAAPLLAAVLGAAAVGSAAQVAKGFLTLALFGLALSLPLILPLLWAPARRALERMSASSERLPTATGILFVALGAWSIYFGIFAQTQG